MDVRLWGPSAWETMHAVTFVYPEQNPTAEEKEAMIRYFYASAEVLPCFKCRKHFKELLMTHRMEDNLENRDQLTRWLVARHNDVNQRLGKPIVSYDFVKSKFDDYRNKCNYLDVKDEENHPISIKKKSIKNMTTEMILLSIVVGLVVILIVSLIVYKISRNGHSSQLSPSS